MGKEERLTEAVRRYLEHREERQDEEKKDFGLFPGVHAVASIDYAGICCIREDTFGSIRNKGCGC